MPLLWLLAFVATPLLLVGKLSLSESAIAQPPYRPHFVPSLDPAAWSAFLAGLSLDNFRAVFADELYREAALRSFAVALVSTTFLAAFGFPVALALARAPGRWRTLLLALVVLPFWTSFLVRVYAWIMILGEDGPVNRALSWLGVPGAPWPILGTDAAVVIGIVYAYCPFMILPLYASLVAQPGDLSEAAADLGASRLSTFWTVTFPLARPGLLAGSILCFVPILGEFVIPDLLGGSDTLMLGRTLWTEFFANRDWPLASAVAAILLVALLVPLLVFRHVDWTRSGAAR